MKLWQEDEEEPPTSRKQKEKSLKSRESQLPEAVETQKSEE